MAHWFGIDAVVLAFAVGISILTFLTAWTMIYVHAPEATKYGTVFLVLGTFTFSLLANWIHHARDEARRNYTLYRVQQMHQEMAEQEQFHPRGRKPPRRNVSSGR